uniref:Protein-methionine sulfoxide oxidase MICAL3 n=1 Tax=Cacopsylla melanoneura TaxID=428564 RepID=A0A8D9F132_9HEMI
MKSGSTSILDTKFKSFVNQINEAQKLLNPAPSEPSVTMQAFLQGADRMKTPLIPPLPLIPAPGVKELVNAKEFPHVCPLGDTLDDESPHVCSVDNVPDSIVPRMNAVSDKPDNHTTTTLPDTSIPHTNDINVNDKPSDVPLEDKCETITKVCDNTTGEKTNDVVIEDNEARPRSPVHETSIIVPDVDLKKSVFNEKTNNWEAIEKKPASSSEDEMDVEETKSLQEAEEEAEAAAESDSCTLSSDDVSTLSSYDENSKAVNKVHMSPPKLEIHNSKGELLLEENCNHTEVVDLVQSNLIKNSADRMNTSMPDVCQVPLTKPSTAPDDKTGSKSVENLTSNNSFNAKIISVPSDETSGSVLKQVNHTSELFAGPEVKSNGRDSPASPVSESMNTGALTETELSDWAREEEPMSEILDDSDFKHISTKNITFRRHQKPKTQKKALNLRGVAAKIAKSEEFDEFPHVCGKSPTTPTHAHPYPIAPSSSLVLTNVDNIEFMDTGNEDSSTEEVEEVNTGYVQFVNANTDDDSELSTPLAPEPSVPYKLLEINHNDEDEHSHVTTTTTSDQVTVKSNNPMPELNDNPASDKNNTTDANINNTSEVLTKSNHILELNNIPPVVEAKNEAVIYALTNAQAMADPTSQAYQDYVQRFQGRVSPFSNARDSIDIRKSRKHSRSSMSEVVAKESLKEDEKENLPSPTGVKPSTSKKLEELSRERTKQKDLIHEMVMNKLLAEGKSPNDRKSKRSSRGSFSPLGLSGAQNALNHPILKQNEHLRTCPITNNFNNYEQTRANQNHNSHNKTSPDHNSHNKTSLEQYSYNKTSPDHHSYLVSPDQHSAKPSLISPEPINSNDEITPTNERQGAFTSLDVYCTPMTSLRSVRARPVSIHSPPSLYSTPCPLAPSPYSLPDIPQALAGSQDDVFTTPRRPPRSKPDFQELRNSARARAKLLSDSQLGLSPEEKLKLLKQKIAQRRLVHSETDSYHSPESNSRPFTLTTTSPLAVTSSQKTTVDESPAPSPPPPPASSSSVDQQSLSSSNRKKSKDRERRKSLIQAVSEFFHKKSPSPPSPSSSHVIIPPTSSTNSMSKFKFPRIHHKHKAKSTDDISSRRMYLYDDKTSSPPFCDPTNMKPSLSESEIRRHLIDSFAPPIPPPPLNYRPSHLKMPSEDSLTDLDDFHSHLEDSLVYQDTEELTVTSSNVSTLSKKQSRHYRRLARQAQHKRLRMAQEIQRQLEELEVKQRELEARGVEVEKLVRGEDTDVLCGDESTLLQRWYDLMRERSELRRLERELSVRAQEIDLEERHARLQHELKERMDREENKTEEDVAIEGRIIQEMLDIVQQRNNLVSLLETDRQRYKEEDQDLEAQILTLKQTHH